MESLSEYETAALAAIKKRTSTDGSRPRKSVVPNSMRAFMRGGGEAAVERLHTVPGYDKAAKKAGLAYIKAARLKQAREALKNARSVTDAATACGFWHFGHFAQDYQTLFGERPSDTLKRQN